MKKSEMEWHFNCLRDSSANIATMLGQRPIDLTVFDYCVETFQHIIPALRYWTKEAPENGPFSILPYRTIELLGPPLFAHDAIASMCEHVSSNRYLKKAEFSFTQMIEDTLIREREALALWNWIERNSGGEQRSLWQEARVDRASGIKTLDQWVESGVVLRVPLGNTYKLQFASDLSAPVTGMCPNCGVVGKARRELVYKQHVCQRCGVEVFYHLVQTTKA